MSTEATLAANTKTSLAISVCGEDIVVTYRHRTVLNVPRIELPAGRTYALLGASGAGKSTLLRVLGLLEKPTRGRVLIDGRPVGTRDLEVRRKIAAVFQKPHLLRGDIGYNVGYGLRLRRTPKGERDRRVAEALERVGLGGWQKRSALTLSGGEAQRVALARALVLQPRLLLLDEPLSYMDPLLKDQLTIEFAEILASENVTALYVTHDRNEAAVVADRIGIMRDGTLIAEGDPQRVLGMPEDEWQAAFLGMEPPLHGVVESSEDGTIGIRVGEITVFATSGEVPGARVLVGIRPEDVLLFESGVDIPHTSARNRIDGRVDKVVPAGTTVRVVVDAGGARLAASVSESSARDLGLAPGSRVTLLFKATAVRIRPDTTQVLS